MQLIRAMLEMLTGHNFRVFSDEVLRGRATRSEPPIALKPATPPPPQQGQSPQAAGFGIEYQRHEIRTETEQTGFQAQGTIRTSDGKIDSGRELFGPASGDGFADLARHDSDGNGWIDESDPVFGELRVWAPDAQGAGDLASLSARQVGALFLGRLATPFELRDGGNRPLGAVRASGVFLADNGSAGSFQQNDLSV